MNDLTTNPTPRCVVVESPCAGDQQRNEDYLAAALRDCIERGEAPIASHGLLAFTGVLDDQSPAERSLGMHAGWAWIPRADALVVYSDLGISPGMQKAIWVADARCIQVIYRSLEGFSADARPAFTTGNIAEVDHTPTSATYADGRSDEENSKPDE